MQGQQVSHYRLTDKLGAGTYGEVWKGVHVHDDQLFVAIKLVHAALATDVAFLTALKAECRVLSRLHHPNIVGFRELALSDAHPPAMVLELVPGGSLEDRLASGPQPVEAVVGILEAMLAGLGHAHSKGVVHRDIKPGNVLLDADGAVRLVDFGIARAADSGNATKTGVVQGTLDYIAPEVVNGSKAGPAADVYAAGLVAWELLSGRRACPEGALGTKLGWHIGAGLADVRTERADCPVWLAEVVADLGAKEASARPVDGAAALALLRSRRSAGASVSGGRPAPVSPGTVEVSTAAVAASLGSLGAGPGTVTVSSLEPESRTVDKALAVPEPARRSGGRGKLLVAVFAVVLAVGGWFVQSELDRGASPENPTEASTTDEPPAVKDEVSAPPAQGARLTIKLTDSSASTSVTVFCPSGFSSRVYFTDGVARMENVPVESCTALFRGGAPAKHVGVSGGLTVTCAPSGGLANCR